MKTIILSIFIILTVIFSLGSMGEKDKEWRGKYLFTTIMMAVLTILSYKFL